MVNLRLMGYNIGRSKIPQYNQQTEPNQCKSEDEEMNLPKPGNWPQHLYLKISTGCHAKENSSEEIISESSQIREFHKTELLDEEVLFNDASANVLLFKPR